jgi:hypothetical protein
MSELRTHLGLVAAILLIALAPGQPSAAQGQAKATQVASGLTGPLYATAPDGDLRLFVVERAGRIRVVKDGVPLETPFLDIGAQISTAGEGGLLGLAFPSDYATSGLFTVYYTNLASDSVVSRFSVSADPDVADADSEELLLFIDQPDASTVHRGGRVHFGPDGFLWFATGDGGDRNNAQNAQSLLGKMLRIDVGPIFAPDSIPVAGEAYRIPADNPFVGAAARDEIWALGLRNPYSWSFDRLKGDLWIGDVGTAVREEVDFEPADFPGGRNYGWDLMEGTVCDEAPPPCDDPTLTLPIFEYDHSGGECSIIGGFVFRQSSALSGLYFFGDWCTGRVWSLNGADLSVVDRTAELGAAGGVGFSLVGFGEDGMGRLLLVHSNSGRVHRIDPVRRPQPRCGLGPELVAVLGMLACVRRLRRA